MLVMVLTIGQVKVWEDNDSWGAFISADRDGLYGDYQGDDGTKGNSIRPVFVGAKQCFMV